MIIAHNDFDSGHTPVSLGHAPWVPPLYVETIREVAAAVRRSNEAAQIQAEARRRAFRSGRIA